MERSAQVIVTRAELPETNQEVDFVEQGTALLGQFGAVAVPSVPAETRLDDGPRGRLASPRGCKENRGATRGSRLAAPRGSHDTAVTPSAWGGKACQVMTDPSLLAYIAAVQRLLPGIAMVLVLAATGCSEPQVSLDAGTREYVASDYPEVLKRWTRTGSLVAIAQLDDLLTVSATYESWDFRWAYVVRYAQDYRLTVEQRRKLLDATLAETRGEHSFYVALYGSNRRWTDLTRPNSSWIVRLIDDQGNETAPSSIEAIAKPGALERTYFPYTTPWRQAFRIRFPRATDGRTSVAERARWFGLRFAGAEGNQELRWEVERDGTGERAAESGRPPG